MLMTIDAGNSRQRFALFHHSELIASGALEHFSAEKHIAHINAGHVIASSVAPFAWPRLSADWNIVAFPQRRPQGEFLDMPVRYANTLGQDRLACAYAAYRLLKDAQDFSSVNRCMIIDAGTFTTVDMLGRSGFEGGYILPGDELLSGTYLRGGALHRPVLNGPLALDALPHSTEDAMKYGVNGMLLSFYIKLMDIHRPELILLTGGAADHHLELLQYIAQTRHFNHAVILQPHLVHFGLLMTAVQLEEEVASETTMDLVYHQLCRRGPLPTSKVQSNEVRP